MTTVTDATPVDAAYFQSHDPGLSPAQAQALATQHNTVAGRSGSGVGNAMAAELATGLGDQRAAREMTARSELRTSNAQLSEAMWKSEDQRLEGLPDATFAPPSSPLDYSFPQAENATEDQRVLDVEFKQALHDEHVPKYLADGLAQDLLRAAKASQSESAQQVTDRQAVTKATLERWYGTKLAENMDHVDRLLEDVARRSPSLGQLMQNTVPLLSPLAIDSIVQFALYRDRRR